MERFEDNDAGYLAWLARHNENGFVVNSRRPPDASYLVLHRARCPSISSAASTDRTWTTTYAKTCSTNLVTLERWANQLGGGPESLRELSATPDTTRHLGSGW